jgi:putative transcriptional regulator
MVMSSLSNAAKGVLLVANPYLGDPNFERGVILLCAHSSQGAFGFVLNQLTELFLGDVLDETIYQDIPLNLGGPVEKNTLHFIHRRPDLITGGDEITSGVFWGGDFEQVKLLLNVNRLGKEDIKFFIGYSGWGSGQLEGEIGEESWIITRSPAEFLFSTEPGDFWRNILKSMGGEFRSIAHYPTDPRLN